jgi:LPXTG-motif cell wall-anchored protein
MENEITVSGQLGVEDKKVPIEQPELPKTSADKPQYTVQQQDLPRTGLLPSTGELAQAGSLLLGMFFLISLLFLISRARQNTKVSA